MDNQELTKEQIQEYAYIFAKALCEASQKDEDFLDDFWNRLIKSTGIYAEFTGFMMTQQFPCKYKIEGCSVVDILIWQIDHFKADLDMGRYEMRENGDLMVLMAFHTMLQMEQNPKPYLTAMGQDTGTDYPGKF